MPSIIKRIGLSAKEVENDPNLALIFTGEDIVAGIDSKKEREERAWNHNQWLVQTGNNSFVYTPEGHQIEAEELHYDKTG